jgi:hypothetical protein
MHIHLLRAETSEPFTKYGTQRKGQMVKGETAF